MDKSEMKRLAGYKKTNKKKKSTKKKKATKKSDTKKLYISINSYESFLGSEKEEIIGLHEGDDVLKDAIDICDEALDMLDIPSDGIYMLEVKITKIEKTKCKECGHSVYKS